MAIVHLEPVFIRQFFRVIPASSVRISKLWGFRLARKSFCMNLIELAHEASPENADAGSHCECVLGEDVLKGESSDANQDIGKYSGNFCGLIGA